MKVAWTSQARLQSAAEEAGGCPGLGETLRSACARFSPPEPWTALGVRGP